MTQATTVLPGDGANGAGLLSKEGTCARPGFNRWLVPPAALAIHLCIGMAYGFSVFWLPLSRAVGITSSVACPADMAFVASLFATGCDWKISTLGWMYTLFFVFLGGAAASWGGWLEHAGPRKAGVVRLPPGESRNSGGMTAWNGTVAGSACRADHTGRPASRLRPQAHRLRAREEGRT